MSKFLSEVLSEFAHTIYQNGVPQSVTQKITELLIDKIGLIVGGSQFSWSLGAYHATCQFPANGKSRLAYFGDRLSPTQAAFVNAAFGHAQDFDDTHIEAITHPGGVIIPTALAIGDETNITNDKILLAMAAGLEIMTRIAYAIPLCHSKGFHSPLVAGPFGAAITTSLLLGLSPQQCTNALNIAGSFAGGLWEYTQSGGNTKRMHCGIAAEHGIKAAYLAANGITGPTSIFEGKFGVAHAFDDGSHLARLTNQLNKEFMINTISLKYYNCPYTMQAAIEALLTLCHSQQIQWNEIEKIDVGCSRFTLNHVGTIHNPKTALEAQFSLTFTLALALLKGAPGMFSYSDENIKDEKIYEFSQKIKLYEVKAENIEQANNMGSIVTVMTKSQKSYENRVSFAKGTPQNALSLQEIESKFKICVSHVMNERNTDLLLQKIKNFSTLKNSSEITDNWVVL